jgi:uncharacterized protein YkwD
MRKHCYLTPLIVVLVVFVAGMIGQPKPSSAAAPACPGANKGPREISTRTAARAVACLVNQRRKRHGKRRLRFEGKLNRAARGHSRRMQKTNCFNHVCPGEAALVGRLKRVDYLPCRCRWGAAENIAWGPGRKGTPCRTVKKWMKSSGHRAKILGSFQHIGVGVRWGSPRRHRAKAATYTLDFGYKR